MCKPTVPSFSIGLYMMGTVFRTKKNRTETKLKIGITHQIRSPVNEELYVATADTNYHKYARSCDI